MSTTTVMLTSATGIAQISTANPNLNGTGATAHILTGAATYGTIVTSITVKATGNTTPGMVRIFLQDSGQNIYLFEEFSIAADDINPNYGVLDTFSATLTFPMGAFKLAPGWQLLAATQNAEQFNVIAEGYDQSYCPC